MFFEKYFFTAFLLLSTKSFLETYYTFDKRDNSLFLNELSRMTKGNIFRISPSWKFNCLDTMWIFFSTCVSISLCLSRSLSLFLSLASLSLSVSLIFINVDMYAQFSSNCISIILNLEVHHLSILNTYCYMKIFIYYIDKFIMPS